MADSRPWFKQDVGYLDNPKIVEIIEDNPNAVLLHTACIAYAKQHRTDGLVPVLVAMRQACAKQCDLDAALHVGLLERVDDRHVMVHDYREHQTSAEEDQKRSDKGKRAADARWSDAKRNASSNARSIASSNAEKRREEKNSSDPSDTLFGADRQDVADLCKHLADLIESNGSKRPTIGKTWHDEARRLIDLDKRDLNEAHRLIDWCQGDAFWRTNILSMPKFREQYDKVRLRAGEGKQAGPGGLSDLDLNRIASTTQPRKVS